MGALYDRMKMDLELKNLSPKTITCYLACMVRFARHYGRSPVEMGEDPGVSALPHYGEESIAVLHQPSLQRHEVLP